MKKFTTKELANWFFILIVFNAMSLNVVAYESNKNATEFKFEPDVITLQKGQEVTLIFKNKGVITHNLTIESLGLKTDTIHPGEMSKLHFTAEKKGKYVF